MRGGGVGVRLMWAAGFADKSMHWIGVYCGFFLDGIELQMYVWTPVILHQTNR